MKPPRQQIEALCPDVDPELIREHLRRLDEDYFERFRLEEVTEHLRALARLSPENPVESVIRISPSVGVECTVLAFDYPGEFSVLSGLLFSVGVSVQSGDVFTYRTSKEPERRSEARPRYPRRVRRGAQEPNLLSRRRIIDCFVGSLDTDVSPEKWEETFRALLTEVIALLEKGDDASISAARHRVNERVTSRLVELHASEHPVLYPVDIEIDDSLETATRLRVLSQDTPAFLYAVTNALSLMGLSIHHVEIRTSKGRIEDEIDLVDASGLPVRDPEMLARIQLSVLLTKQCTYFLDKAPDPYTALSRFEQLTENILRLPESGRWVELLSEPRALQDLARILGASDYLWEDFIRLQYESLLPILAPHVEGKRLRESSLTFRERLDRAIDGATSYEDRRARINRFKDQEIFLLDLDHIVRELDFRGFATRLSRLAVVIVDQMAKCVAEELVERHGWPRTVGQFEATWAIFGLGKLGGAALGYASDIELLLVYSDHGETDGEDSISNAEFFGALMRKLAQSVEAKREGIFHIDLRLRPYGDAGPMASSLANFCEYYGPDGPAHSFERLALVRLRAISGDEELGRQVESLRDEFVYRSDSLDLEALRKLRYKQYEEKTRPGEWNAKFSPGALVDLEYGVQTLQVLYAIDHEPLRTPRIHVALDELPRLGILDEQEARALSDSYDFLRVLINALRMLRGNAKDMFLPPVDSDEFIHLARRMGYESGDLGAEEKLRVDFATHTATVRAFVEHHLGRRSLPGPPTGNVADLVLSGSASPELREHVLVGAGFREPERAYANLLGLAAGGGKNDFARLAVLAVDKLRREPDPDMALNNWERFSASLKDRQKHYRDLLSQPKRLEILLGIFSRSQFLADTLIRNPEFYDWITTPDNLHKPRRRGSMKRELRAVARKISDHGQWLDALRRWRRRELLRIGARDMYIGIDTSEVMLSLTSLAEAVVQVALESVWRRLGDEALLPAPWSELHGRFCILAFGKLGGRELNYSSDIDLIGVYDDEGGELVGPDGKNVFGTVMSRLRSDLSEVTPEGYAYRVDLRLRPYGRAGEIVSPVERLVDYYETHARLWEVQALLKLRPVAGNLEVGYDLLEFLYPILYREHERLEVTSSIQRLRDEAVRNTLTRQLGSDIDVKNGTGGIRDVEFLAQGLQLVHLAEHPGLLTGSTMEALVSLQQVGILPEDVVAMLLEGYVFLRRLEHYLQILHDRQSHSLPRNQTQVEALAKRMSGVDATAEEFLGTLETWMAKIHSAYVEYLFDRRES